MSAIVHADEFSAEVHHFELYKKAGFYTMNVRVAFVLSPVAKRAIQKGVPLSWVLKVRIQQEGWFWNKDVFRIDIPWVIQYQALLNLYSVTHRSSGHVETFSTLVSALNYMSVVRGLKLLEVAEVQADKHYYVAVKIQFNREFLPPPLRPESYFDSGWFLSSDWFIWPIQK